MKTTIISIALFFSFIFVLVGYFRKDKKIQDSNREISHLIREISIYTNHHSPSDGVYYKIIRKTGEINDSIFYIVQEMVFDENGKLIVSDVVREIALPVATEIKYFTVIRSKRGKLETKVFDTEEDIVVFQLAKKP